MMKAATEKFTLKILKYNIVRVVRVVVLFMCGVVTLSQISGCDETPPPPQQAPPASQSPPPTPINDTIKGAWHHYHIHGVDAIAHAVACAGELKQIVQTFMQSTTAENLQQSRTTLETCWTRYQISRVFVAANPDVQTEMDQVRQQIAAPLTMPGFIDAVTGYPFSGIVNDASLPLSKESLLQQQGLTDISEVSIGFSVLRFLLWGEYFQNDTLEPRPIADFQPVHQWTAREKTLGLGELNISEHPNNRRRRYMELAVLILEEHLNQLATTWNKHTQPPQNMNLANQVRDQIATQILAALKQIKPNYHDMLANTLVPLFIPFPSTADNEPIKPTLSDWLVIKDENAAAELTHQEKPLGAKLANIHLMLADSTNNVP